MLYSLVLTIVLLTTQGPVDIDWVIPDLPEAVCKIMQESSELTSIALQGKVYQAGANCLPQGDPVEEKQS